MAKAYKDRQMKSAAVEQEFFFPKANPPRVIKATSREEAEKKLAKSLPETEKDNENK